MGARFLVNVTNNSSQNTTFILFQKDPNGDSWQNNSVVWLSKRLNSKSKDTFEWNQNYQFVAGNTGPLMPGVTFNASVITSADSNATRLDYDRGSCNFSYEQGQPGRFVISVSSSIPMNGQISTGIGMSDSATIITQARPNMNYQFSPNTEYWIAFGDYNNGQVLPRDVANAARISFPNGANTMNAVLGVDNQFTITKG